jgi:hypothetical protein
MHDMGSSDWDQATGIKRLGSNGWFLEAGVKRPRLMADLSGFPGQEQNRSVLMYGVRAFHK